MYLYVLRHAWSEDFDIARWPDDSLRPLTPEGQLRFRSVAKKLVKAGVTPEWIATSPLVRCRQTAQIFAEVIPGTPPIVPLDALAPGSDLAELLRWTWERNAEQVAWVGHAPDVEQLTAALVGGKGASIRFGKGTCAAIRFDSSPAVGLGTLYWLTTARVLGR